MNFYNLETSESAGAAQRRYRKKRIKQVGFSLNKENDADIIAFLYDGGARPIYRLREAVRYYLAERDAWINARSFEHGYLPKVRCCGGEEECAESAES